MIKRIARWNKIHYCKVFSLLLAVFNYFDERVQLCMFFLILFLQHYCSSFYEVSCISKSVI